MHLRNIRNTQHTGVMRKHTIENTFLCLFNIYLHPMTHGHLQMFITAGSSIMSMPKVCQHTCLLHAAASSLTVAFLVCNFVPVSCTNKTLYTAWSLWLALRRPKEIRNIQQLKLFLQTAGHIRFCTSIFFKRILSQAIPARAPGVPLAHFRPGLSEVPMFH